MSHITPKQFIDTLVGLGFTNPTITRSQLQEAALSLNLSAPPSWAIADSRKISRGIYNIPEVVGEEFVKASAAPIPVATMDLAASVLGMTQGERTSLIPAVNPEYVPWGHYNDIRELIDSEDFFTIYVTGMSGNGKTTMIEQICANLGRECYRVNIIGTTDEDDLIGGMRLSNGSTTWHDGPVVEAMKRGAILLLDEIDLGSERLMCLQSVLEGKGVYLKKRNEWITPAKGFAVIATANTKGKGSDDGRFIGTNVLNEAFLDRFDYTYEQDYASKATEKKIILKAMGKYGVTDADFAENLVIWAEMIRKSFMEGAVDEIISTRRLLNIVKAYSVFRDKKKAVNMSLARFDKETQGGFFSLYNKIDAGDSAKKEEAPKTEGVVPEVPF
jgi:midasin (ATPase involved in ribosome maturation)